MVGWQQAGQSAGQCTDPDPAERGLEVNNHSRRQARADLGDEARQVRSNLRQDVEPLHRFEVDPGQQAGGKLSLQL